MSGSYKRSVHGASDQATAAATRSAARRQCPKCGRKSALVRVSDDTATAQACRWLDCGYTRITVRCHGLVRPCPLHARQDPRR